MKAGIYIEIKLLKLFNWKEEKIEKIKGKEIKRNDK